MGLCTFGFPLESAQWLKERMNLDVFIEAGTYHGGSARQASGIFQRVVTIEKSPQLFENAKKLLAVFGNISCYLGCTRDHVVEHIDQSDHPLFWLDAHWSGGETAGRDDECPLLDELKLILAQGYPSLAILIDDARLFTAPPPLPHSITAWPRLDQICAVIPNNFGVYIHDDVIFVIPVGLTDEFGEFLQALTTQRWKAGNIKSPQYKRSILSSLKRKLGALNEAIKKKCNWIA